MKKRKTFLSLFLVIALFASLCACEDSNANNNGNGNAAPDSGTTQSPADPVVEGDWLEQLALTDWEDVGNGIVKSTISWWRADMDVYRSEDTGYQKKGDTGTLVIRSGSIAACDPNANQDEYGWSYNVYEPLFTHDMNTGEMVPLLATEWGYADDGSYEITLREGVKFHSGNDMTAEDVLYTFERVATNVVNTCQTIMAHIDFEKSRIIDDYHLVIEFSEPSAAFEAAIATGFVGIVDKDFLEANPNFEFFDGDAGTGAYTLVETVSGLSQTFKRFDDWWGGECDYETIICKNYTEMTVMEIDYENGDLDITNRNSYESTQSFFDGNITDTNMFVCPMDRGNALNMCLLSEESPFHDVNVRLALAHCIDYEAMITAVWGDASLGRVPDSFYCPGTLYYEPVGTYEYNVELAKEYLKKAGYDTNNRLTVRAGSGTTATSITAIEIIQGYAREIGIDMELTIDRTVLQRGSEVYTGSPEFDVIIFPHYKFGTGDPAGDLTSRIAYGKAEGEYNKFEGFDDQHLCELIEKGEICMDPVERQEIYEEIQQILYDNCYYIGVEYSTSCYFARSYIGNVQLTCGNGVYWAALTYEG